MRQSKDRESTLQIVRGFFSKRFRPNRMKFFQKIMQPRPDDRILDVGGYPAFWESAPALEKITILNIHPISAPSSRFEIVVGNGTAMDFRNGEFDIVHSNSVIEHVGDFEAQKAFATELRRVGRKLWVQTPARSFPVEPHFLDFLCHWFPFPIRRKMIRYFSGWGWICKPSQEKVDEWLKEIRLLNKREMVLLFPDCRIEAERVCGLAKSYIAIRE